MNMEKNPCTAPQVCPEGAIDLGIVMTRKDGSTYKLFWAKSNLSEDGLCDNPEDYGDYYAWGETEPKKDYTEQSYKFYRYRNTRFFLSKYKTGKYKGSVDDIIELQRGEKEGETEDDAARAKLGGKWRMPTDAEWTTLRKQCIWTWSDDYNGTGVAGYIVAGKADGYTDKSIFLPAAGGRSIGGPYVVGSCGLYWSSSLHTGDPYYALYVYFFHAGRRCYCPGIYQVNPHLINGGYIDNSGCGKLVSVYRNGGKRYYGRSVRPVSE